MRVARRTLPILLVLLGGCVQPGELRLHLAQVSPDPLEEASSFRLRFSDGDGERVLELPFDGAGELSDGFQGEVVVDLQIEALSSRGLVLARGGLPGDVTPPPGLIVDETVALLRVGGFSRIEGLELDGTGADPCIVSLDDGRLLIAGGDSPDAWLLDPDRGELTLATDDLPSPLTPCQGALLADGRVVLAGGDGPDLQVIHGEGYTGHESLATGREGGALAGALDGGLVWWMGGTSDAAALTSEVLISGQDGLQDGPRVEDAPLSGHRLACSADGSACAVFGGHGEEPPWWRVAAADVAGAVGGFAIEPLVHEGELPDLPGRLGVSFDDRHVLGLLEDDDVWLGLYDVGEDGALVWSRGQPAGLMASALASAGDGRALLVGGHDGSSTSGEMWMLSGVGDGRLLAPVDGAILANPRRNAAAAALPDGRVIVVGGTDGGEPVDTIEIYQPTDAPTP